MLLALRATLVAVALGWSAASAALAGTSVVPPGPDRGRAAALTDAELEDIFAGGACAEGGSGECGIDPAIGPVSRIILWDERIGDRSRVRTQPERISGLPPAGLERPPRGGR